MSEFFDKNDQKQRRRWRGYWIHFYAHEHIPPKDKPLNWIHLHFRGQTGEVELYLKKGYPNYRIVRQWGRIGDEDNYEDIVAKIQKDLKDKGIEWKGTF